MPGEGYHVNVDFGPFHIVRLKQLKLSLIEQSPGIKFSNTAVIQEYYSTCTGTLKPAESD